MGISKIFLIISFVLVGFDLMGENFQYEDSIFSLSSSKTKSVDDRRYMREKNYAVAFYLGEGLFVSVFHVLLHGVSFTDDHRIVIETKEGDIIIDQIVHADSAFDLIVLRAKEGSVEGLRPLSLGLRAGDTVLTIDFDTLDVIPLLLSEEEKEVSRSLSYKSDTIEIIDKRMKDGMSGAPLLLKDRVRGILSYQIKFKGSEVLTNTFIGSHILLRLLETEELECSFSDCIEKALITLKLKAKEGHREAFQHLAAYLLLGKGMEKNEAEGLRRLESLGFPADVNSLE